MDWAHTRRWLYNVATSRTLFFLLFGQIISLTIALNSFLSSLIANLGLHAPVSQLTFNYFAIAVVYGTILLRRYQKLRISWYWYLLLGFVDVEGNYLVNKSYQYTSLTSVSLLGSWIIPWVIVLRWLGLGIRYTLLQLFGAAVCVLGLGLVLLSDSGVGGDGGPKPLVGDALVIVGMAFYGLSAVGEELCVKVKDSVETLAMLGSFGCLVSLIQLSVVELPTLKEVRLTSELIYILIGYTVGAFVFCSLTPVYLKAAGASSLNLSTLTSGMWSVIFRVYFYGQKVFLCYYDVHAMKNGDQVDWLYFVAFAMVAVGLIIYFSAENVVHSDPVNSEPNLDYEVIHSEDITI